MRLTSGKAFAAVAIVVALVAATALVSVFPSGPRIFSFSPSDNFQVGDNLGGRPAGSGALTLGYVQVFVYHEGKLVSQSAQHNTIVNTGEDVISRQISCGATNAPSCANTVAGGIYMWPSQDSSAAAATDTSSSAACKVGTSTGTTTFSGLNIVAGSYTHGTGTNTHSIFTTFTYTGSYSVTIAKMCMFDTVFTSGGVNQGSLFAESLLSSTATVSANGDQITVTWTFTH